MSASKRHHASFRDPSGFVYFRDGLLLRQINAPYRETYLALTDGGLYSRLFDQKLLIPHQEEDIRSAADEDAIAVLRPDRVRTVSYPYEWCFSQLKDAALATLRIQRLAIEAGMSLKDASAYNIQFHEGLPLLVDSLSFEPLEPKKPWKPYRQFCQHFVAPLVLMSRVDPRLGRLAANYIDGIPLDLASKLSKPSTRLSVKIGVHLHLHARLQGTAANQRKPPPQQAGFGLNAHLGLIQSLESLIEGLNWKPEGTEWAEYYSDTNYSESAMATKKRLVSEFLVSIDPKPESVWDLGANNGEFSAIASGMGIHTVAWDVDPAAVERNYIGRKSDPLILPLIQDLTNPSPSIGWNNRERESFLQRGPADVVLALALIHHLAIGNNVPLDRIATFLAETGKSLIIEFVPKEDSQVQRLLSTREDVFPTYTQQTFEDDFQTVFRILRKLPIEGTARTLYLMRRRDP